MDRKRQLNQSYYERGKALIREKQKDGCLFCGCHNNLQEHHPWATDERRVHSFCMSKPEIIISYLKQTWTLCKDCHIKLHRRMIDPLPSLFKTDKDT